jgi:hypothetical protein
MKLLFIATIFISTLSFAQESKVSWPNSPSTSRMQQSQLPRPAAPADSWMHLNPLVGVNVFGLVGNGNGFSPTPGFTGGLLTTMGRGDWALQTGVLYAQQGVRQSYLTSQYSLTYSYVEVPLMAKYRVMAEEVQGFHVLIGAIPQYMLAATGHTVLSRGASSTVSTVGDFNRFGVLAAAGLGADMGSGSSKVTLDFLYNRGLIQINKQGQSLYSEGLTITGGMLF